MRAQLEEDKTVVENVADGYDSVRVGGKTKHVIGYLQDFLFTPDRARTPVRFLSGGERNRVLLARLFAKPANVVVLDEPTNDLDMETLELLEELLVDYAGTVLLVSHDRAFLNNVVAGTIVFEDGAIKEYVGGYDDWLRQRASAENALGPEPERDSAERRAPCSSRPMAKASSLQVEMKRRLTYKEQQQLAALPDAIGRLETEIARLHEAMVLPEFYRAPRRGNRPGKRRSARLGGSTRGGVSPLGGTRRTIGLGSFASNSQRGLRPQPKQSVRPSVSFASLRCSYRSRNADRRLPGEHRRDAKNTEMAGKEACTPEARPVCAFGRLRP